MQQILQSVLVNSVEKGKLYVYTACQLNINDWGMNNSLSTSHLAAVFYSQNSGKYDLFLLLQIQSMNICRGISEMQKAMLL